jgi:hypothetical protein
MLNVKLQELQNYEAGDLSPEEIIDLFRRLIDSGLVHSLNRRYVETADALWNAGLLKYQFAPSTFRGITPLTEN